MGIYYITTNSKKSIISIQALEKTTYIQFKDLKIAYLEIKDFIEEETGDKVVLLNSRIYADLGCAGDDNYDLIDKFVTKYSLDYSDFNYSKHFLSEGEISSGPFFLLSLLVEIIFWAIRFLTIGKVNLSIFQLFASSQRITLDLTFGDMLTWYLSGKYNLRRDVKYLLRTTE